MTDPNALDGDGINLPFFNLLWSKNMKDEDGDGPSAKPTDHGRNNKRHADKQSATPILRVPDTVVFLFGQPHQWYFTSKNGGPHKDKTTILRKRRANITLANIEEVFLNKAASRGEVGDDDVVAYFISSKDNGAQASEANSEHHAGPDGCNSAVGTEVACNIEYFSKATLHAFLQHGRNDKSGILQRFIAPHGGGRHNSQIRCVWTPKCRVLERRRTKQDLRDTRFALYERAITFDGPDVYSVSVPLRGTVLSGRVESICNEIVRHISDVAAENAQGWGEGSSSRSKRSNDDAFLGVARMVVNFKVDGNGKIWILWSNSIRLQTSPVDRTRLTDSDTHSSFQAAPPQPLNMETVIRLPSSIKLTQEPNHNANVKADNSMSFATCPSCNVHDANAHFQPVPYKTVIHHFEKTLAMLEERDDSHPLNVWPPENRFIKAAGNVGFGALPSQLASDKGTNPRKFSPETHVIPPVIRQTHPKLRVKGYMMYRNDPLFLLKTCKVCEDCFLSYAELTSTSFVHMTRPVQPYETEKDVHYDFPNEVKNGCSGKKNERDRSMHQPSVFGKDLECAPELPPAITEPPKTASLSDLGTPPKPRDTLFNTLPTYFPSSDCAKKNLGHLIDALGPKPPEEKEAKNPYEEDLERLLL